MPVVWTDMRVASPHSSAITTTWLYVPSIVLSASSIQEIFKMIFWLFCTHMLSDIQLLDSDLLKESVNNECMFFVMYPESMDTEPQHFGQVDKIAKA
jgi:hypothetical protein